MAERAENNRQTAELSRVEENIKGLNLIIKDQDEAIEKVLNTAFQLANYYFVFQGVILAAISNAKSLDCDHRWFLFTLSLLAIVVNLCALLVTGYKFISRSRERQLSWGYHDRAIEEREILRGNLPGQGTEGCCRSPPRDLYAEIKHWAVLVASGLVFIAFAIVTLLGSWGIACKQDYYSTHIGDDDNARNCVTVCEGFRCMKLCQYYKL